MIERKGASEEKPKAKPTSPTKSESPTPNATKLAVIRIRGRAATSQVLEDALKHLNLKTVNKCAVLDDTPTARGMILKVNNHVTWGEINAETLKSLGEGKVFSLSPPRRGHGSVKKGFKSGGALGYRGDAINDLIGRMQ